MSQGIAFGDYRLLRRLGEGGMAEVFLARRDGPGGFQKQLVLKKILPHLAASPRFVELFLQEARYAALVDHPNLVHVSGFGEVGGEYYLAMEFVDGFTVADLLERTGKLAPGAAVRIILDILEALNAIHGARDRDGNELGLVHRDLSPRNVMLTRDGAVKLLDFGIAAAKSDQPAVMGTRRFMSPEQSLGEPLDARSDLFGAGVLLYSMLAAVPPFTDRPGPLGERPAEIPEALWPVLERALALAASERFGSARQMQAPLELFLSARGLEGTRAQLAELLQVVLPFRRRASERVLSRITQIGQITRVLRATVSLPSGRGRWLWPALIAVFWIGAASAWLLWPAEQIEAIEEPAASITPSSTPPPSPPPIPPAQLAPPASEPAIKEPDPRPPERRGSKRRPGRLTIDTQPWTEVYWEGRRLGMTPLEVALPPGVHELKLENKSLDLTRKVKVTIRSGKTTRVQKSL